MSPTGSRDELRRDFPAPAPEEWRAEAERLLRGAPFEEKLRTRTPEGLLLEPLYTRGDLKGLPSLGSLPTEAGPRRATSGPGWLVAQEQALDDPAAANARLLAELPRGLDAVLTIWPSSLAPEEFERFLRGVDLAKTPIFLHCGAGAGALRSQLEDLAKSQRIDTAALRGAVAADPLGHSARTGSTGALRAAWDELAETTLRAAKSSPQLRSIWIRGERWHEAGSNAVQELGITLSILAETLRAMEERGVDPTLVASKLMISLGVGGHYFTELCKLRAVRGLVAHLLASCGVEASDQGFFLHARCSSRNKSRLDEPVNLLRSTTEAFAAAVGGADSIHVEAFDSARGRDDEFSRRLARNQQIILREEAQLGRVIDPAQGSWYVERFGAELAAAAWSHLQEIEAEGGFSAALRAGKLQRHIEESRAATAQRLSTRREIRVGTNQYPGPLAATIPGDDADQAPRHSAASAGHSGSEGSDKTEFPPVPPYRECAPFEELRSAVQRAHEEGTRVQVFVVTLGDPIRYMPRLDFTDAAFQVGGFEIVRGSGYESQSEAVEAARRSGAKLLAICGLDESYHEMGPALASALKESCPDGTLVLAGLPDEALRTQLETAGVEHFLHLRCDLLALLQDLAMREGVQS